MMNPIHNLPLPPPGARPPGRGLTLVELLVVIAIIAIVFVAIVPMLNPVMRDRRLREAARQTNSYFAAAQARAIRQGGGVGVAIKRLPDSTAVNLATVEDLQPYAGDTFYSKCQIENGGTTVRFNNAVDFQAANFIRVGDMIRFNHRGPRYVITAFSGGVATIGIPTGVMPPAVTAPPGGASFEVTRGPLNVADGSIPGASATGDVTLPNGTCVDLVSSGLGPAGAQFNAAAGPVIVMFGAQGEVERVYYGNQLFANALGGVGIPGSVFLHITEIDRAGDPLTLTGPSYWVTIRQRTGKVTTADNAGGADLAAARTLAVRELSAGGN